MTEPSPGPGDFVTATCAVCGTAELQILPFRYAFHDRFLYGARCERCSLVCIHPQPSPEEIRGLYTEEYFVQCTESCGAHGRHAYMEEAAQSGAERPRAAARLDRRMLRQLGRRGRLLEIGCGPGFLLDELRQLGWEVAGLEISPFAVAFAREQLHLTVELGDIDPDRFPAAAADAVFLGDVLEHLPEPVIALRSVRRWLSPGGVVMVAVPSTLNLVSARLGLTWYAMRRRFKTLRIPPYHLFEYTPATLRRVIRAAGLRPLRLEQSAVPLGKMGLRGSPLENAGKVSLQLLAHASARLCNRGGDRLLAIAINPPDGGNAASSRA
jgi:SAM-dependent methyltransferase